MMRWILPLLVACSSTVAASAQVAPGASDQASLPPVPGATSKLLDTEDFSLMLGRWRGEGHFGDSGEPLSSTMIFEKANGKTIALRAFEDAPNLYRYSALWSVEKGTGRLLMLMASSLDGPALYQSKGWQGGRLVFEPDIAIKTGPSSVRFTYVRINRDTFELTYEYSVKATWRVGDKQVFKRVG